MASIPRKTAQWQPPLARLEGDRLLRQMRGEAPPTKTVAEIIAEERAGAEKAYVSSTPGVSPEMPEYAPNEINAIKEKVIDLSRAVEEIRNRPNLGGAIYHRARVSEGAVQNVINGEIGVTIQAHDEDLDTLSALAKADGNFIVADGTNWTVKSGTDARDALGLGTAATTAASAYATAAQGTLADTAVQPADIGTAAAEDVGYFATAAQGALADSAVQPGDLVASKFNSQAVAASASISASTDFIEVGGLIYQRVTATHPRLGAEIVSNGSMASDTIWTKGAGWSIGSGVATKAAGTASNLSQPAVLEDAPYFFSYQITAITASLFRLLLGSTITPSETTTGVKAGIAVATAASSMQVNTTSTTAGSVDNVSLRKLPADAFQSADGAWWAQPVPLLVNIVDAETHFGVTGDGVTDDSAAVLRALTYMALAGGNIIFPENCLLSSLVDITGTSKGFNIIGGSFLVNNSTGGIKITTSAIDHRIVLACDFIANTATAGRPFEVIFPVPSPLSWRTQTLLLDKVECRPKVFNDTNYKFLVAPRVENAWHGQALKYFFNGNSISESPAGLIIDGYSINFDVISSYATNVIDGFVWNGESEGARALFTNVVSAERGFVLDGATMNPQATFLGCHTNVKQRGIQAVEWNNLTVMGHLFYRLGAVANYKDIEITDGVGHVITGNNCAAAPDTDTWFVYATDVDSMIVKDNHITARGHQVQIEGTSKNCIASNNVQETLVAASYADELVNNASGAGNKLLHWKAENWHTVTLNASGTTNDAPTSTPLVVTWNTTPNYNDQTGFASGTPTRITPPAWVKSVELTCSVEFESNATGYRLVTIRKNGSTVIAKASCAPANGTATNINVAPIRVAHTAGDYYEVVVTQNSGSTLSVASALTKFECRPVS